MAVPHDLQCDQPDELATSNTKMVITTTRVGKEQARSVVAAESDWGRIRTQCHLDTVRTTTEHTEIGPSRPLSECSRGLTPFP